MAWTEPALIIALPCATFRPLSAPSDPQDRLGSNSMDQKPSADHVFIGKDHV